MGHRRRSLLSRRPKSGGRTPVLDPKETPAGVLLDRLAPGDEPPDGGDPGIPEGTSEVDGAPPGEEAGEAPPPERPKPVFTPRHKMMSRGDPRREPVDDDPFAIDWVVIRVGIYAAMLASMMMLVGATVLFLLRHEWMALLGL